MQDAHRQRIIDWCDATQGLCAAFDFTTKGLLQEAILRGEYWRLRDNEVGMHRIAVAAYGSHTGLMLSDCSYALTCSTMQAWPWHGAACTILVFRVTIARGSSCC